jgi:hypothetical protein
MSTLAVNTITNAAGANTAQINGMTPTAQSLQGFRNRLINSDMRIDQRNAGAAVTLTGIDSEFPVDRFKFTSNTTASLALQQVADAPQGFVNSIRATVNTADASPAVGVWMEQPIEGLNVSDLGWGTANAQAVTISFWVKSTLTGTFGASLQNSARNRSYPFTYSISAANTWEQKTVTVAGDTSGTWLTTNGVGIYVISDLGLTGSLRGTAGSWAAADYRGVTRAVSVIGTLSATWQITGVQLEAGSVATPFERRPYGTELALCQRYAVQLADGTDQVIATGQCFSTSGGGGVVRFPVEMRAAPTITASSAAHFSLTNPPGATAAVSGTNFIFASTKSFLCEFTGRSGGGLTAGDATLVFATNSAARLLASAEL